VTGSSEVRVEVAALANLRSIGDPLARPLVNLTLFGRFPVSSRLGSKKKPTSKHILTNLPIHRVPLLARPAVRTLGRDSITISSDSSGRFQNLSSL